MHLPCDGLRGLSDLCLTFNSAEVRIVSLKADKTGSIYFVIEDNGSVDLDRFEAELKHTATLVTWTTQIDYLCFPFSLQTACSLTVLDDKNRPDKTAICFYAMGPIGKVAGGVALA